MSSRNTSGFTLVELMIVLVVSAIVLGIGVPAFADFIATNRMAASVNDLVSGLHLARSEAVKRRANSSMCPSSNWNSPNPACNLAGQVADGWIIFVDCSVPPPSQGGTCGQPNLVVDAFDTVFTTHGPMPDTIAGNMTAWPAGTEYVSYGANGFPRIVAGQGQPKTDFQLCDHRGNHDAGGGIAAARWVQITTTGRPQIYRDQSDIQGARNPLNGC
jgi:type IV fimbrial biogenesis protein FimT